MAEQSLGLREVETSGREILCKLTLPQVGTCFDTVLKILLLMLALALLVLDYFLVFTFLEPNKFPVENELKFFAGQRVVQKRCVGKAASLSNEAIL